MLGVSTDNKTCGDAKALTSTMIYKKICDKTGLEKQ